MKFYFLLYVILNFSYLLNFFHDFLTNLVLIFKENNLLDLQFQVYAQYQLLHNLNYKKMKNQELQF